MQPLASTTHKKTFSFQIRVFCYSSVEVFTPTRENESTYSKYKAAKILPTSCHKTPGTQLHASQCTQQAAVQNVPLKQCKTRAMIPWP